MPPVRRSDERKLLDGFKKLFRGVIESAKNGATADEIRDKGKAFLESEEADSFIRRLISRMVKNIRVESARNWREAATKGTNGRMLYRLISQEMQGPLGNRVWELIADNVAYIKTVPQEWANYITQYAAREALKGKRPDEVEAALRKVMPEHMTKNLKCIARTECAKANAAIVQARAEMCGIRCYFWRCVKDERSRESHRFMDGILCFYDDPPNPEELSGDERPYGKYHAGNTFNCRCYQETVVDNSFLPDTFRYHRYGRIYFTTRTEFLKEFGSIA